MGYIEVGPESFRSLKGKVVVITGGSSGIGLATVKLLVANGATVINGDLKPPQGLTEKEAASVAFQKTDVSDWDSLRSLFDKAVTHAGRIDHVFANAGAPPRTTFMDLEVDDNGHPLEPTHRVLDINLKGLINTVALAIHHMKHQKQSEGGSILITSSAAGYQRYFPTDYTVAKHGALGLMRGLYPNLCARGLPIRVNTIFPSWTATGMVPADLMAAQNVASQPPEAVAGAACLLMADEARNGQAIYIGKGKMKEVEESILIPAACEIEDTAELNSNRDYQKLMATWGQ